MILQMIGLAVALWAAGGPAAPAQTVERYGAWSVTLTMPEGQVTGLAILSQDGLKITGMIRPAETDMMPTEGTVSGDTVTLMTRPRYRPYRRIRQVRGDGRWRSHDRHYRHGQRENRVREAQAVRRLRSPGPSDGESQLERGGLPPVATGYGGP